jgi:hypothetical protein
MKRRPSRITACTGKGAMSATAAKKLARAIREKGDRVAPYLCMHCKKWHVGNSVGKKVFNRRPRPVDDGDGSDG